MPNPIPESSSESSGPTSSPSSPQPPPTKISSRSMALTPPSPPNLAYDLLKGMVSPVFESDEKCYKRILWAGIWGPVAYNRASKKAVVKFVLVLKKRVDRERYEENDRPFLKVDLRRACKRDVDVSCVAIDERGWECDLSHLEGIASGRTVYGNREDIESLLRDIDKFTEKLQALVNELTEPVKFLINEESSLDYQRILDPSEITLRKTYITHIGQLMRLLKGNPYDLPLRAIFLVFIFVYLDQIHGLLPGLRKQIDDPGEAWRILSNMLQNDLIKQRFYFGCLVNKKDQIGHVRGLRVLTDALERGDTILDEMYIPLYQ